MTPYPRFDTEAVIGFIRWGARTNQFNRLADAKGPTRVVVSLRAAWRLYAQWAYASGTMRLTLDDFRLCLTELGFETGEEAVELPYRADFYWPTPINLNPT